MMVFSDLGGRALTECRRQNFASSPWQRIVLNCAQIFRKAKALRPKCHDDDQLVADGFEFVFKNQQFFVSRADDAEDCIAGFFQRGCDRQKGGVADAAADTDDGAEFLDMGRLSKRTCDIASDWPTCKSAIWAVGLPTAGKSGERVPFSLSAAIVRGDPLAGVEDWGDNHKLAGFSCPLKVPRHPSETFSDSCFAVLYIQFILYKTNRQTRYYIRTQDDFTAIITDFADKPVSISSNENYFLMVEKQDKLRELFYV
jgi:hypothetical protein